MLHIFTTAANAVLPIVLLMLLGNLLRSKGFLTEEFVKIGSKLVFRVALPSSLFINVYNIADFSSISWDFILCAVGITLLLFALGYLTAIATTKVPQRRGVIVQCVFRSNFAIIGLPLAATLGGDAAMATASLVSAFILPLFNILAVITLSAFVDTKESEKRKIKPVLLGILKNPLVIGAFLGMVCVLLRKVQILLFDSVVFSVSRDLPFVYTVIQNIKVMTTPLALIVAGAQFRVSAVKGMFKEIAVGTLWRIVLAPILGIGGALILQHFGVLSCGTGEIATMIALFGAPAAVSGAVMAGEMGNDEQLATQYVVWTSIGSMFTVFLLVCILMATGVLVI